MAGPVDPRLLRRARATRNYLVAGVGVGIATAILVIIQAWLLSRSVVEIFATHRLDHPEWLAGLAAVVAARAGLGWLNQWIAARSAAAVKSQLRSDIVAARLAAPAAGTPTAELVTLMTKGLDALDGYFSKYLPQLALAATVPFIVGAVILATDWVSAITLAVTLPLIPIFMALIGWRTQASMDKRWAVMNRLARHFGDLIAGLPTLQAFGRAKAQSRGVAATEEANRRQTMTTLRLSFLSSFALEFLSMLSVAVIAVGIGLRVVAGQMEFWPGLFVLVLAPEAYTPIRMVGVHYHDSADGVAAANQAFDVIDAAHPASGDTDAPSLAEHPLIFDAVSYTYPGAPKPALRDVSFEVAPSEVVAIAGRSGGGKSTALHALMGLLTPTAGAIRIGEVDLADVDATGVRAQLAWVGQEPGMITGTIADNVALGLPREQRSDPDPAVITEALRRAGGAELDPTRHVGDDGEGLSAGERRRVALARALLRIDHGARLLVLDEPTAGLDADTEADVIRHLRATAQHAGALVVTHRPAVLAAADRVVEIGGAAA